MESWCLTPIILTLILPHNLTPGRNNGISEYTCRTNKTAGRNKLLFALGILLMIGCAKEEDVTYSNIPEIQLLGLSHDTIRQYEDVLTIRIFYKDGDGDIGFEDPETYALFVRDIRLGAFDGFYVGPLAPPDANVPIQGELSIEFPACSFLAMVPSNKRGLKSR